MIFMALASNERVVTHLLHPQWIQNPEARSSLEPEMPHTPTSDMAWRIAPHNFDLLVMVRR